MTGKTYYGSDLAAERRQTIEQCAKIADAAAADTPCGEGEVYIARKIADKIRLLLPPKNGIGK